MAYKKLDPEFKTRWLKALRSGRYKQAIGMLRHDEGVGPGYEYCCLGVACNLIDPKKWLRKPYTIDRSVFDWGNIGSGQISGIPGIDVDASRRLAHMNDNGSSFKEIADWIERNL